MKPYTLFFSGLAISFIVYANIKSRNLQSAGYSIGKQLRTTDEDMDPKDLHQSVSELAEELDEYDEDAFLEGVQDGYYAPENQEESANNAKGIVTNYRVGRPFGAVRGRKQ